MQVVVRADHRNQAAVVGALHQLAVSFTNLNVGFGTQLEINSLPGLDSVQ